MAYTKLFASIITSTVWSEDHETRIVWITMLAMADKNGEVQGSIPGLARIAAVSLEGCRRAIQKFLSPDEDSRTKDEEGRRIEEIDGGWRLLNYAKYRLMASRDDQKAKAADRQARFRERHAGVTESNAPVTQDLHIAEAEAEADKKEMISPPSGARPSAEPDLELPLALDRTHEGSALRMWNTMAEGSRLPIAQRLTGTRRVLLKQRLASVGGLEGWRAALDKVAASPFLTGKTERRNGHENWRCDLDFILREKIFTKLMEGGYDSAGQGKSRLTGNLEALAEWADEHPDQSDAAHR